MAKYTSKSSADKPEKPYPDFPLFAHATGQWAKKIRGRMFYFGVWSDWEAALALYKDQADDLHAGRTPRPKDGFSLADLCNHFRSMKEDLHQAGELTARTVQDYTRTCDLVIRVVGKDRLVEDLGPDDFQQLRNELAKKLGPVSLTNELGRVRVLFKYGYDSGFIPVPVRYGQSFKRPSKKTLRKERHAKGKRLFDAKTIKTLLDAADDQLKAMILLGINAALGNADIGTLPRTALDLKGGWLNFPRQKTGVPRRCPLWKETIAAIRAALKTRPKPKDAKDRGLVFLTKYGQPWYRDAKVSPLSAEFRKLCQIANCWKPGLCFYTLRHTHRTIADASRDFPAAAAIMGHAPAANDMGAVYREEISDDRLLSVVNHVHGWLFGPPKKTSECAS